MIDVEPHGMNVMSQVRSHFPVAPVVMVGDQDDAPALLEALRQGLERYIMRVEDEEMFVRLASQVVYGVLEQSVEPPNMEMPSAEQMHRYAHYHHILHPFFVVGPGKRVLYLNAAAERLAWKLVGQSPVIGESVTDGPLAQLGEPFDHQLGEALEGRESIVRYEFEGVADPVMRSVHCQPLTTSNDRTVATSIAIHQQTPPEVARSRTLRAIGRFAGGLAHDINNLLNVMMVQSELLRAYLGEPSAPVEKCLDRITAAVDDGSELTREMLAISHEPLTHRVSVQLNPMIEAFEPQLRGKLQAGQRLRLDLQPDLPPVEADPQQIEQLIGNLVQNAVDTGADELEILIRTALLEPDEAKPPPRGLEARCWLELTISDTGPGMHPKLHSRAFEPFFTTRRGQGHSGLGLTIVHAIVEQLKGSIFVDSEPGQGAVFTVYLPAADWPAEAEENDQPEEAPAIESSPATVLLVEDEEDLRLPFCEALSQRGYNVLEARDVATARDFIKEHGDDIDLVITDVVMPGGSGVELVRECLDQFPEVKVIFVSGYTADVLEETGGQLEVDYVFLAKPVSLRRLTSAAEQLLAKAARADESRSSDGRDKHDG
ncbi:response regulator [Persicimonas caeni]|uniref:ATP-binding response regulator n=1 Tax=Persicimonas caeni TaxID=2292766 RepID=UPI0011BB5E28|nr:ATP-binding protein [Persicimonas caeni]QED35927.1 response regulator [Persicimonas caeni]